MQVYTSVGSEHYASALGLVQVHLSVGTVARSRCAAESACLAPLGHLLHLMCACRFIQVWDEDAGRIAYDAATVRTAVEEAVSEALY